MASPTEPRSFTVAEDDDGIRLDRWFKRHMADISFNQVSRWARTGQLRVDGKRAGPGDRVAVGQSIRDYLRTQVPAEGRLPRLLDTLEFWGGQAWTQAAWMLAGLLAVDAGPAAAVQLGQVDDFSGASLAGWSSGGGNPNPPSAVAGGGPLGAGDDFVFAGAGNDTVRGREGNDFIDAEAGDDNVLGEEGDDTLRGGLPAEGVSAPNGVFATADGFITVLALNNDQFERLCRALDLPHWLQDARFASNAGRMAHRHVLHAGLGALALRRAQVTPGIDHFRGDGV